MLPRYRQHVTRYKQHVARQHVALDGLYFTINVWNECHKHQRQLLLSNACTTRYWLALAFLA